MLQEELPKDSFFNNHIPLLQKLDLLKVIEGKKLQYLALLGLFVYYLPTLVSILYYQVYIVMLRGGYLWNGQVKQR